MTTTNVWASGNVMDCLFTNSSAAAQTSTSTPPEFSVFVGRSLRSSTLAPGIVRVERNTITVRALTEAVRHRERGPRFRRMADVTIAVGAGQGEQQRPAGMRSVEGAHRSVAAACVQCQHQIRTRIELPLLRHGHRVSGSAQHRCPAQRGVAVAAARAGARGGDKRDSHGRAERLDWRTP
jgi:hypothetical protein